MCMYLGKKFDDFLNKLDELDVTLKVSGKNDLGTIVSITAYTPVLHYPVKGKLLLAHKVNLLSEWCWAITDYANQFDPYKEFTKYCHKNKIDLSKKLNAENKTILNDFVLLKYHTLSKVSAATYSFRKGK